jgi:hypothetical protein
MGRPGVHLTFSMGQQQERLMNVKGSITESVTVNNSTFEELSSCYSNLTIYLPLTLPG